MQQPAPSIIDRHPSCVCSDLDRLERKVENLQRALETRQLIGIAQGIIIARGNCGPEKAFEVLSRASQRQNRKVVDLARQIVAQNAG